VSRAAVAATPARRRPSAWGWLVAVSASLVIGAGVVLTAWWLLSSERTVATYSVRGSVNSIALDLGSGDAEIVGGGDRRTVEVRRTDDFSFGRRAVAERRTEGGGLAISSRCPQTVFSACSVSYRLTVPDNVLVNVRTSSGDVRFAGYQGSAQIDTGAGDVSVGGFCGFSLRARTRAGDVSASASCPPERLELRSRTGDVRAVVPPGRYQVDADTDGGSRRVEGVTAADDAPFLIQALSSAGDVEVETSG
jgi:hypothetical protein